MRIDKNVLEGHEYITLLKAKIQTLEDLVRLRDSQIARYRELLTDIGAEIELKTRQCLPHEYYEMGIAPMNTEAVHIRLDRTFGYPLMTDETLRKINEKLEEYE